MDPDWILELKDIVSTDWPLPRMTVTQHVHHQTSPEEPTVHQLAIPEIFSPVAPETIEDD